MILPAIVFFAVAAPLFAWWIWAINALWQSRKKPVHVDAVPLGFHKKISQVVAENERMGKK